MQRLIVLIIVILTFTGCGFTASTKPSILVIAVEHLNSDAYFCGDTVDEFTPGFGVLCHEGVRFSHAYTPSTMSQPALASILTGLYPKDNGVTHNGSQHLSEKFVTVSEVAFSLGYRTAFFSGGPPIWRKSGFDQGFELFEDNINVNLVELYRPAKKNFQMFTKWLQESYDGRPFYSVIYVPDLQFVNSPTLNNEGQERARNYDGQLREINESLVDLIRFMKEKKYWDNTYIILTGLNGKILSQRVPDINTTNLQSDSAQVLLMIKPAQKNRDAVAGWSIDTNVTLVDLSATLLDVLGRPETLLNPDGKLEVASLKKSLLKPQADWSRDRFILTDTSWPQWRNIGTTRFSLRQNNLVYVHDQNPLFFNSLTDRWETQPLNLKGSSGTSVFGELQKYFKQRQTLPWVPVASQVLEKIRLFQNLKSSVENNDELKIRLSHLIKNRVWDRQIIGWLANLAIETKDWVLLEKLGAENFNPLWVYVAKRNRGFDESTPTHPCWKWLDPKHQLTRSTSACNDESFMLFAEWTHASTVEDKTTLEEKFARAYIYEEIDMRIAEANYITGLAWDTDVALPGEPSNLRLALMLPEYKGFRQVISSRILKLK